MSKLFAAYQRVKAKAKMGEFNFIHLSERIAEIKREEFANRAGYLVNFDAWRHVKEILGLLIDEDGEP